MIDPEIFFDDVIAWLGRIMAVLLIILGIVVVGGILLGVSLAGISILLSWPG